MYSAHYFFFVLHHCLITASPPVTRIYVYVYNYPNKKRWNNSTRTRTYHSSRQQKGAVVYDLFVDELGYYGYLNIYNKAPMRAYSSNVA